MLWFYAMARIPLAEVTAIGFSTPVFTALGAVFLLGEQVRLRRALAIVAGFVGMLVILRPGFNETSIGSLAQLCATLFFAGSYLLAKRLTREESALDIIIMLTLCSTLALLPAALYDWRAPTPGELGGLAGAADRAPAADLLAAGVGGAVRLLAVRRGAGRRRRARRAADRRRGQLPGPSRGAGRAPRAGARRRGAVLRYLKLRYRKQISSCVCREGAKDAQSL